MKLLAEEGYKFIFITNQPGIERGKITSVDLGTLHQKMLEKFKEDKIDNLKIYYSPPHHRDEYSFMWKPILGKFFQASKELNIRMDKLIYISDDTRDCEAAFNAGCSFKFIGLEAELKHFLSEKQPIAFFDSMIQSLDLIKSFYNYCNT